jgi:hypothetical protein
MRRTMRHRTIGTVRCDALFVSPLQPSEEPSAHQVQRAVAAAIRQFGRRGCAGGVAQEFGEHPEVAAARMRWVQRAVAGAFGCPRSLMSGQDRSSPHPGRAA